MGQISDRLRVLCTLLRMIESLEDNLWTSAITSRIGIVVPDELMKRFQRRFVPIIKEFPTHPIAMIYGSKLAQTRKPKCGEISETRTVFFVTSPTTLRLTSSPSAAANIRSHNKRRSSLLFLANLLKQQLPKRSSYDRDSSALHIQYTTKCWQPHDSLGTLCSL